MVASQSVEGTKCYHDNRIQTRGFPRNTCKSSSCSLAMGLSSELHMTEVVH